MTKRYQKPETEIILVRAAQQMLTVSNVESGDDNIEYGGPGDGTPAHAPRKRGEVEWTDDWDENWNATK